MNSNSTFGFPKFGSLAFGHFGRVHRKFGRSRDAVTQEVSAASTGLRLVPIKTLLIYRFDYMALHWNVPLVPYVKAGLVAIPWWVTNGADVEIADDLRGAGVKFGAVGVLGLSVLLDVLDQRLARDFDNSMGVNHGYLFAEFALQEVTGTGLRPKNHSTCRAATLCSASALSSNSVQ